MLSVESLATSAQPVPNACWMPTCASSGKADIHLTNALRSIGHPSMFLRSNRDKRNLLGSLSRHVCILLQSTTRGKLIFKELSIKLIHPARVLNVPQINCGRYDIGKSHVSFLKAIQKVAHGLSQLQFKIWRHDSLVWNEPIFGREIKGVAVENARTGSRARRHILGADR